MIDTKDTGTLDILSGGQIIGYARVSTPDQKLINERAELAAAGCVKVFEEKISASHLQRPELLSLLEYLREGDTVVVTCLDRWARDTIDVLFLLEKIHKKGARFKSLAEPWIDTTTPAGVLVTTVIVGFAQFERSKILTRTSKGRKAAQQRGVKFGRTKKFTDAQALHAKTLIDNGTSPKDAAALIGVHRTTLMRRLEALEQTTFFLEINNA